MNEYGKMDDEELVSEDPVTPPTQNLWDWLESPQDVFNRSWAKATIHSPLAHFYQWGLNYDMSTSPFNLFRDLVGWSEENIGTTLYDFKEGTLGYVEADYLGDALKLWADNPTVVEQWLDKVSMLETADYDG